ncbi:MAG: hypothetical protein QN122_13080 [Armatimonadota bacterium]|nr:hypothetical protein [Armatimonadota bacterium]MDR7528912.1 hypothetical protein [Armatimonadota bacterium]
MHPGGPAAGPGSRDARAGGPGAAVVQSDSLEFLDLQAPGDQRGAHYLHLDLQEVPVHQRDREGPLVHLHHRLAGNQDGNRDAGDPDAQTDVPGRIRKPRQARVGPVEGGPFVLANGTRVQVEGVVREFRVVGTEIERED